MPSSNQQIPSFQVYEPQPEVTQRWTGIHEGVIRGEVQEQTSTTLEAESYTTTTTTSSSSDMSRRSAVSRSSQLTRPLLHRFPSNHSSLQEEEALTAALMRFILKVSSGRQVYLLADNSMPEVGVAARVCGEARVDTILLTYEPRLLLLESLLRSPLRPLDVRYVLVMCTADHMLRVFQQVRTRALESMTVWWFVVATEDRTAALQALLREGSQTCGCVYGGLQSCSHFQDVTPVSSHRLEAAGKWRPAPRQPVDTSAWSATLVPDLLHLYADFGGRQLTVAANDNWPFLGLTLLEGDAAAPRSGIDINILDALGAKLNFTYQLVVPRDRAWGGPQPDGSVTGLIGMVARHEAHVAICEITITDTRETVVDFTATYWLESLTLVSRAPKEKERSMAVFWPFTTARPGSIQVWGFIAAATLLMGPVAWVVMRCSGGGLPLQVAAFNMFRSIVVQTNFLPPKSSSLRFVFIFWYFFCFIIYAMYSGTLTAVLAIPSFDQPVDSLTDLPAAVANGFAVGTLKASSTEFLFRHADGGIYKQVWELFHPVHSLLPDPELGFDKVLEEKFVLVNSELNAKIRATVRGREKYHFGRDTFYPHGYGIACISGAPFRPKFEQLLQWIVEAGLVTQWGEQEIQKLAHHEAGSDEAQATLSLTLEHLQASSGSPPLSGSS
ncbi:glutamate receptor ionotropic, kainate 3-like [Portunus trituberculatus]|uniref:glutamate receptor ionotropic, kainate 3-like n=1 Tax=Portunus trituberculatus TaxID=210409 RepID=UPI001E1CEE5D|nr:glutamate receptor ionotropic, kainate 3-like [Portunus trituberculatus]